MDKIIQLGIFFTNDTLNATTHITYCFHHINQTSQAKRAN